MRARAWSRPFAVAALLVVTTLVLLAGYAWKEDCFTGRPAFSWGCYSDAPPLWHMRNFDEGVTPYLDRSPDGSVEGEGHPGFLEYPLLTGVVMWLASVLTHAGTFGWPTDPLTFLRWNALFLAPFALGTGWLLARMAAAPWRPWIFAAAPALFLYAFHNWDLIAVFFLVLAVERLEADRPLESGAALGVGAAAKLFPIVAAPLLFLLLWRRSVRQPLGWDAAAWARSLWGARDAWRFTAGVVGVLVALHVPLLLAGGGPLYLEMLRFHAGRSPNFESVWFAARTVLDGAGLGWRHGSEGVWPTVALGILYALSAVWVWWRGGEPRRVAFVALFPLLLTNVFFSVQYVLWLLPFFALLRLPLWSYGLFVAADLAVYSTLFDHFADAVAGRASDITVVAWLVLLREAVFVLLVLWIALRPAASTREAADARPQAEPVSTAG